MLQGPVDTTVAIWEHLYKVRIPYLQSRTIDDIREKGTVISGIASYDADIKNQLQTTYLSINQMVDYFKEGVAIRVCDKGDPKLIYEAISEHIYAWKYQLEKGINIGDAPIEDLVIMDKFAGTVYEHAKHHFNEDTANSIFAQHFGKISTINASNFFAPTSEIAKAVREDSDGTVRIHSDEPDRESLGDFFKSRVSYLRRF
jgi:hypothetical protein